MEQVKLYDTTLRDGMQGEGMSLSAAEKVRVVRALDELGVPMIEAGFPSSNPKEEELFEALADTARARRRLRLRHDPAPRTEAAERPGAPRPGRLLRPRRHPGRQDLGASPGEGHQGLPRGEPGDDRRLGRLLPRAWQAGRLRRRALLRRLPRRPRLRAPACAAAVDGGAENVTLCDTNGASLPDQVAAATRRWSPARRARRDRIHAHDDAELRRRQLPRRRRRRGAAGAGHESTATASAAATPTSSSILPALQLKMGFDVVPTEQLADADRDRPLRRRALQPHADPDRALCRPQRLRPQGRACTSPASRPTPRTFEHIDPAAVGNERASCVSELSGKATIRDQAARRRDSRSTTRPPRGRSRSSRSASTAATTTRRRRPPSSCCCATRRASTSRCSSSRATGS